MRGQGGDDRGPVEAIVRPTPEGDYAVWGTRAGPAAQDNEQHA